MHLQVCEHPVRIRNKVTGHIEYVPCGKCNVCKNTHNSLWVQRLEQERLCWKYAIFFTLTYDERHVPQMLYTHDGMLYDFDNDFVVDPSEIVGFSDKSRVYMHRRKRIYYVSVRDVQLFVKRFRYYSDSLNKGQKYENKLIRYFISAEYGPTTIRPHYHGVFFTNSQITASNFEEILCKAWKNGRVDYDFVKSNASSYVAQYLNCVYSLPKVYLHRQLRPFCVCSKCPPIGSLHYDEEEVFKIFNRGIVEHSQFNKRKNSIDVVPLLPTVKSSIFPKVQGYGNLTHIDRVALYGIARFSAAETFAEFKEWCLNQMPKASYSPWMSQLAELLNSDTDYPLMHLWQTSNRVLYQAAVFDCTLDYYVSRIENYYRNFELYKLKKYYEWQETFSTQYGVEWLLYLDPFFVNKTLMIFEHGFDTTSPVFKSYALRFSTFGIDLVKFLTDGVYRLTLSPEFCPEFSSMIALHNQISRDSSKTKRKNDYLNTHPEQRIFVF